ncbi:MAG: DNRLRE domain-containing protein [Caldilinea sp.]
MVSFVNMAMVQLNWCPHSLMYTESRYRWRVQLWLTALIVATFLHAITATNVEAAGKFVAQQQVFVPYWPSDGPYPSYSIFWLGEVSPTKNYADVRLIYDETSLKITIHIIDRRLWYDETPSASDLKTWDAISLFLDHGASPGAAPGSTSYQIVGQLWVSRDDQSRRAIYQGNNGSWMPVTLPVEMWSTWRGNGPNDQSDDKGWQMDYVIPFSALGLSEQPAQGATWSLAVAVHDRDDRMGTLIPDTLWPKTMNGNEPASWGLMTFGLPRQETPVGQPTEKITIREGVDGVRVYDAHVGGHTTCGEGIDHWSEWGEANYAGYSQINIQNQWDISDYPCFSKYYITFPLEHLPRNREIISATLTMNLFGNAGYEPGQAPPSSIHAFAIGDDWDEATINWNNAPQPTRNLSMAWVYPVDFYAEWPGIPYTWDVSSAAAEAYNAGEPLRLALYSTEGEMHSGKYFWSSDADEAGRPKLEVYLGDSASYTLSAEPQIQVIAPGATARYSVSVSVGAGVTEAVQLMANSEPASSLSLRFEEPTQFQPPGGQTTLIVTDTRQKQPQSSGQWYTILITAATTTEEQVVQVKLLIASEHFFLPIVGAE